MAVDKSEFVDGKIYAKPSARRAHDRLGMNLLLMLSSAFRNRSGIVFTPGMKVRSELAHSYYYPAASALCGEPAFLDEIEDVLLNPSAIFEIYSDTTIRICRHEKFAAYELIPSFSEYALISVHEYRVHVFTKRAPGDWSVQEISSLEESFSLRSIEVEIPMSELYRRVTLAKREP